MPLICFLFIGPYVCSTLLSDGASRRRPCDSLSLHLHQVVKMTFTFELSNMLGTLSIGRRSPADPCHTTVRTGPYTAIRARYANTPRSTMEVRATENRHWTDPSRGLGTEPDTKGRVSCPPCCARATGKPPARARQLFDGVVFSTAATERPVAAASGSDSGALRAFHRIRSSCANPEGTGLTPLLSFPCRRAAEDCRPAHRVQLRATALGARAFNASGVRGQGRFAFRSVEYHRSGSVSRLP
jgi:hypothetical protein